MRVSAPLIFSFSIIALHPQTVRARLAFAMQEPTAEVRRKAPPCGNPRCTSPEKDTRLQFIPAGFSGDVRPGATCYHVKRAVCRRHFLGGEPGRPGRPSKRACAEAVLPGRSRLITGAPCPPIVGEVDELWGVRCAPCPRFAHVPQAQCLRRFGRYCDISEMSGEHRGNVLKGAVIEYCVHGHFFRSKDDENGRYGAWWVPLRRLVRQLGKEEVKERVAEFKAELARLESDAIVRAEEEEDSSDSECQ